jgi:choice-of-anchor C domain-containing protein
MRRIRLLFPLAAAGAVAAVAAAVALADQPLIKDGNFETPVVAPPGTFQEYSAGSFIGTSPWKVTSGNVDLVNSSIWSAASGQQSIDLNGIVPGAISQKVKLTIGGTYTLGFWLAGSPPPNGARLKKVIVYWDKTRLGAITFDTKHSSPHNMMWEHVKCTAVAANVATHIAFKSGATTSGPYGPAIDLVTLDAATPGGAPGCAVVPPGS